VKVIETPLPGVMIIESRAFEDERGFFMESFQQHRYAAAGIPGPFVQDNVSFSSYGVLRGLHFQHPRTQGKLVYVLQGEVFDVAVDVRQGSPTYGKWFGTVLSAQNRLQLWVAPGMAHGFCVTSDTALFVYKCTDYYQAEAETSLAWNDADIAIGWPLASPTLSAKDARAPSLRELDPKRLPVYGS
jgi:dTDP-4-dehydrorhamnose 3,5-epimerase